MIPSAALLDDDFGIFHTSFPACPLAISAQLSQIDGIFANHGLQTGLSDTIQLVLAEILNNIAKHAVSNREDHISLNITVDGSRVFVLTQDGGRALPPGLLDSAELPTMGQTVDDLPEGGFGWFIIHSLVDDMIYERDGGMNKLSFSLMTA